MPRLPRTSAFRLTLIAETGERFDDFAPYVASVNDAGVVAFQAAMRTGGSGVFAGDGESILTVADSTTGPLGAIRSHPDVSRDGELGFYADLKTGGQGAFLALGGELVAIARDGGQFQGIGPLGPTLNDRGTLAFRANLSSGRAGIFAGNRESVATIADTGGEFSGFQGLPVINQGGTVAFMADLRGGGKAICASEGGGVRAIVETGDEFVDLAPFPSIDDRGAVAFAGTRRKTGPGVFGATADGISPLVGESGLFESYRSALINCNGLVAFCATPRGGQLGVFSGPDPVSDRIISLGEPLLGSRVTEFALNPVSVNEAGQLAIRVGLENKRQAILRADPFT